MKAESPPLCPTVASGWCALPVLCLLLTLPWSGRGQAVDSGAPGLDSLPPRYPVMAGVAVFGNSVTVPEIIVREITIEVGERITPEEIEYSRERIYSLGLFNRVDIQYPPMDSTVLVVQVDERLYVLPHPILGVVDGDLRRWQYGAGFLHTNFRGRNEKLFAGFALGYNPWVEASYENPWIFGDAQMFSTSRVKFQELRTKGTHPLVADKGHHETIFTASQLIGKRIGRYNWVSMTLGWKWVKAMTDIEGLSVAPDGVDRYPTLAISHTSDTRNLAEYPTAGVRTQATVQASGLGVSPVDFVSFSLDLRWYRPIFGDVALCLHGFGRVVSGPSIPGHEHSYFGYGERIRGHFDVVREGENIGGASAELRIPLVRPFYVVVPDVPIRELAVWRLGLYLTGFIDAGTVWDRDANPFRSAIPFGYGAGLNLLLPYGLVGRAEWAMNDQSRGEVILSAGVSF